MFFWNVGRPVQPDICLEFRLMCQLLACLITVDHSGIEILFNFFFLFNMHTVVEHYLEKTSAWHEAEF